METRGTRAVVRARGARRGGAVALFGQLVGVWVWVRARARARVVGIGVGVGVRGQFGVRVKGVRVSCAGWPPRPPGGSPRQQTRRQTRRHGGA